MNAMLFKLVMFNLFENVNSHAEDAARICANLSSKKVNCLSLPDLNLPDMDSILINISPLY